MRFKFLVASGILVSLLSCSNTDTEQIAETAQSVNAEAATDNKKKPDKLQRQPRPELSKHQKLKLFLKKGLEMTRAKVA